MSVLISAILDIKDALVSDVFQKDCIDGWGSRLFVLISPITLTYDKTKHPYVLRRKLVVISLYKIFMHTCYYQYKILIHHLRAVSFFSLNSAISRAFILLLLLFFFILFCFRRLYFLFYSRLLLLRDIDKQDNAKDKINFRRKSNWWTGVSEKLLLN